MRLPVETLLRLARHAKDADTTAVWPAESWEALSEAGALRWVIPPEQGGLGVSPVELLQVYEALAGSCLTTTFILSQRDAACRRLRDNPTPVATDILRSLARGDCFATVGLSQLTTSRQHGKPALIARLMPGGLFLDGSIPWVTGATRSDYFVVGGVLEDGKQIMTILPRKTPGLTIGEPFELAALEGSMTAELSCTGVFVEDRYLLAGPQDKVIVAGKGGTGSLETSCLALGLASAAIDYLTQEATSRAELGTVARHLEEARQKLRDELHQLAERPGPPEATIRLRAKANSFVLHASQAALIAGKGAGFLKDHPAQRWARQALFFLVWSCPRPAADAMLAQLTTDGASCP